jgi:hypothetical protein
VVAAWVLFSALLVTTACMSSSRISHMEEPLKESRRRRVRQRKAVPQVQSSTIPATAETLG